MPIEANPDGTLDIENATLRSRNIVSLTSLVAGNDVVRSSAAPTLEVYGDPSNDGGLLPRLELVSNVEAAGSAFTRLTSNAGVFTIQSGTSGTADSKGDIAFSSIGGTTEHMRIQGSTGRVGVGTTNPGGTLHVKAQNKVHITAETTPAFTGLEATSSATGRAQLVLTSMYSDLVIASSQTNENHGSTLSFAAVNPSNTAQYRKFVIGQGNWGARKSMLDFGYLDLDSQSNPHAVINSTGTVLTLDGLNKRVGIGAMNPVYPFHVNRGDSSFSYYGPNSYGNYLLVGAAPWSASTGAATIMTTNGNLHIDPANGSSSIYLGYFAGGGVIYGANPGTVLSDDRVKEDEKYIKNSLQVLKKLKPQTYLQRRRLEDENSDRVFSAGLIAQEVYYNCPELRHTVRMPITAYVDSTKEFSDDPQIDPDYSDWGEEAAGVKYGALIPYTISAVNQLSNEVSRRKIQISNVSFSNVLKYHGLVVSKNSDVYLSDQENDSKVYGVISDVKAETNDSEFLINYRGDSKVWVINVENIQAGDYITTSNVPGYATKQDGNTLKNYTVAKSSIDCDFIPPMIYKKHPVQTTGMVSRWKKHSNVTVSESTYLNLPEDIRDINSKSVYTLTSDNSVILSQDDYEKLGPESNLYTETTKLEYIYKSTQYKDFDPRGSDDWIEESISKTFDSLDENGQIIWENTDTQLPKYPIKYITIDGTETDQPNATYTAALIDCSIVCG